MESIHAHQVLNLLADHGEDITVQNLKELLAGHFGENPTFRTCGSDGMNLEQLIEFFVQRGKIQLDGGNISLCAGCGCGH